MHYTGSAGAQEILDNLIAMVGKFVLVMPNDFRRA